MWQPPWAEERSPNFAHWKEDMVNNARSAGCLIPVKEKPVPQFDEILRRFQAALPGDWETKVENWEEQLQIVQHARPGARWARQDRLYAEIVAREAEPYLGFAWSVRDLFKHVGKGSYVWFSVAERKWRTADSKKPGGRDQLIHVISAILNRHLGTRWLDEFGGMQTLTL